MRLWRFIILLEMMLEVVIGVIVMEVDKVANEVTDMEVDYFSTSSKDLSVGQWPSCNRLVANNQP